MFFTSLYMKVKQWLQYLTAPNDNNVVDEKNLEQIMTMTEVDVPSESESEAYGYNEFY